MITITPDRIPVPTCVTCRYHHTRYHPSKDLASPAPRQATTCYLTHRHVSPQMTACPLFRPPSTPTGHA